MTKLEQKQRDLELVKNGTIFILSTEEFDTTLKIRFCNQYKQRLIEYLEKEIKELEGDIYNDKTRTKVD